MALVDYDYGSDDEDDEPAMDTKENGGDAARSLHPPMTSIAVDTIEPQGDRINLSGQASRSGVQETTIRPASGNRPGPVVLPSAASLFSTPGGPTPLPSPATLFSSTGNSTALPSPATLFGQSWAGSGTSYLDKASSQGAAQRDFRSRAGGEGRKRPEPSRDSHLAPHHKLPRGTFPPQRTPLDTDRGQLIPPQLQGRKNVATEDLDKLFVRKGKRPVDLPS